MKIIYSPECSGTVWTGVSRGICLEGYSVKNTTGLVELLEFKSGIHYQPVTPIERTMTYRKAMKNCPELGVYAESFKLDDIAVARECLKVRDAAMMAGWKVEMETGLPRFESLREIEKCFDSSRYPSLAERIARLKSIGVDLSDNGLNSVLVSAVSLDTLPTILEDLIYSIHGCEIKTIEDEFSEVLSRRDNDIARFARSLSEGNCFEPKCDGSLKIYKYPNKAEMMDDLVFGNESYDLWINKDNVMFDSWSQYGRKPAIGASASSVSTQTVQLFITSMGLFLKPDNLPNLLAYLASPECPVPNHFDLKKTILCKGGYEKIDFKKVGDLLPLKTSFLEDDGSIRCDALQLFCDKFIKALDNKTRNQILRSMFAMLSELLDEYGQTSVSCTTLKGWVRSIYQTTEHCLSDARVDSTYVVPSPDCQLAPSGTAIWLDLADAVSFERISDILSKLELDALDASNLPQRESRRWQQQLALPVRLTQDSLVLCLSSEIKSMENALNPLLIKLLYYKQFDKEEDNPLCVLRDNVQTSCADAPVEDNETNQDEHGIVAFNIPDNGLTINRRPEESPSSLEILVQDPLDYVMKYILDFEDENSDQVPNIFLVKGNVAHLTIQDILCGHKAKTADDVRRVFDSSFQDAVMKKGLSLLEPRNEKDYLKLKDNLLSYTIELLEHIDRMGYVAEYPEYDISDNGKILNNGVSVRGSVDLLLHKKEDESHKLVIDFKYTTKAEDYKKLVKTQRAIQLAIYRECLIIKENAEVDGTAYFLMSDKGAEYYPADSMDYARMIEQVKASYEHRYNEILSGRIELGTESFGEGMIVSMLDYYNRTVHDGLLPLRTNKSKKGENKLASKKYKNVK